MRPHACDIANVKSGRRAVHALDALETLGCAWGRKAQSAQYAVCERVWWAARVAAIATCAIGVDPK